jgi:hypothetical protein
MDFAIDLLIFLVSAFLTYLFLDAASITIGVIQAIEDRAASCKHHTWPTEGPMICLVCKHNPQANVASKEDFEIED